MMGLGHLFGTTTGRSRVDEDTIAGAVYEDNFKFTYIYMKIKTLKKKKITCKILMNPRKD